MKCTAEFTQRSLHPLAQRREDIVSGQNSASRLDRVLGPRSPVLRRSIAGIPSHGRPITGTGVRRIGRRALISIARSTGISGLPRVAWRRRGRGSGVGVSRVAWRSVTRGGVGGLSRIAGVSIPRSTRISGVSRVPPIPIARLRVAGISVAGISVAGISVGWVAVISARWRRRCTRDSSKNPGCPSNRCSKGRSRPATRRCSNRRTRSRSQDAPTKAALDGIIWVCAGRETQGQRGNQIGRNSGHYRSPLGRQPGRTDNDNGYNAPFLSMNPALRLCEPEGLTAAGLENLAGRANAWRFR